MASWQKPVKPARPRNRLARSLSSDSPLSTSSARSVRGHYAGLCGLSVQRGGRRILERGGAGDQRIAVKTEEDRGGVHSGGHRYFCLSVSCHRFFSSALSCNHDIMQCCINWQHVQKAVFAVKIICNEAQRFASFIKLLDFSCISSDVRFSFIFHS